MQYTIWLFLGSYQNPIIDQSAADPTVILANDGYFYLYATGGNVPVYRSKDLVEWKYIGSAFTAQTRPNWEPMKGRAIWAPEIRYIKDKYVLYYSWAIWGKQMNVILVWLQQTLQKDRLLIMGALSMGKKSEYAIL